MIYNPIAFNYSPTLFEMMMLMSYLLIFLITHVQNHITFAVQAGHMDGIKFFLSTRAFRDIAANMTGNTIYGDFFDPRRDTKILIHGFMDYQNGQFIPHVLHAYLAAQDVNVISVDWSWWIGDDYLKIIHIFLRVVAKRIAIFIKMLVDQYETDLSKIHLIGHSLGAHAAGMAGLVIRKYFKGKKLGRITGLDPAGEGFSGAHLKLTKYCAEFVDTIHTDDYALGLPEMNSHVDFYVNGGSRQPGCGKILSACSHNMAHHYWENAILNRTAFLAVKCDSWVSFSLDFCCNHKKIYLGERTSKKARGAFYLSTSAKPPYGLGKEGVRVPQYSSYLHYIYAPSRALNCST